MICCKAFVTPDGYLANSCGMDFETAKTFPKVCHVSEYIWGAIRKYNVGRMPCTVWLDKHREYTITDEQKKVAGKVLRNYIKKEFPKKYAEIKAQLASGKDPHELVNEVLLYAGMDDSTDYNLSEKERDQRELDRLPLADKIKWVMMELGIDYMLAEWYSRAEAEDKALGVKSQVQKHDFMNFKLPGTSEYPDCVCCCY